MGKKQEIAQDQKEPLKLVISQPMYLPWAGLFEQIKHADIFIHYDDVPMPQGRSFLSRVQIKHGDSTQWLTVPIQRNSDDLIRQVTIDPTQQWPRKHARSIQQSLAKAPYYGEVETLLAALKTRDWQSLCALNIHFIETISHYLGFNTRFLRSSNLPSKGHSSEKLHHLCQQNNATHYITGHGAKNYLDHSLFERDNIAVEYMDYHISPYPQFGTFTPYVSIIDLIAHCGQDAVNHFQSTLTPWQEFTA